MSPAPDYRAKESQTDSSRVMAALSARLDVITPLIKGKFVYLDYPVHANVGDLLIWFGAQEFLKRNKKKPLGQYSINNIGYRARREIERAATICFHGGGNLGDLWPIHQKFREELIQRYPGKRIIIFPQSVNFEDENGLIEACAIFKKHPDLHICLRDKNSYALLKAQGVPNLILCPDMAHALWGKLSPARAQTRDALYLLRRDKEKASLPVEIRDIEHRSTDWDDLLHGVARGIFNVGTGINHRDARASNLLPSRIVWNAVCGLLINRAVQLFSAHEKIVTNRLHAMILAALLGKKAVVYDNSYGKISSYADLWMRELDDIEFRQI